MSICQLRSWRVCKANCQNSRKSTETQCLLETGLRDGIWSQPLCDRRIDGGNRRNPRGKREKRCSTWWPWVAPVPGPKSYFPKNVLVNSMFLASDGSQGQPVGSNGLGLVNAACLVSPFRHFIIASNYPAIFNIGECHINASHIGEESHFRIWISGVYMAVCWAIDIVPHPSWTRLDWPRTILADDPSTGPNFRPAVVLVYTLFCCALALAASPFGCSVACYIAELKLAW